MSGRTNTLINREVLALAAEELRKGDLTAEEAKEQLMQQGLVEDEDEAYWTIRSWDTDGASKYSAVFDAVLSGSGFDEAMEEMTAHGYQEEDVLSHLKGQIRVWYTDQESEVRISKQEATDMLRKYFDMKPKEVTATINRWTCKVVTGIAYPPLRNARRFHKGLRRCQYPLHRPHL